NAVVLNEVPPNTTCVGVPAKPVKINGLRVSDLDQIHIPDPVSMELCRLNVELEKIKKQLAEGKEEK
ncbi:MAG: serine O-acetyltransferase, partial [Clostridia bacterium]|nr:serine O-acetyltransferase [Clostridia bacterium]